MDNQPYTAQERVDAFREELSERGFALISHVADPSFIVVPPRAEVAS